jgi:23S rRNA (cytosine1962-C5)-methyltransferase
MKVLNEGGVLSTFSCSHNMPNELFSGILKDAAKDAGKEFTILKRCHQAPDHPIVREIPETDYLKGYFLKVYNKKTS